jgi:hypothetical protein
MSKKDELNARILYRNIAFYDNVLKAKSNKPKQKLCAIVQILADKGHATIPTALNLFEQI